MALPQRIESLQKKHATLKQKLHQEQIHPSSDDFTLQYLKQQKLRLKDEIASLLSSEAAA